MKPAMGKEWLVLIRMKKPGEHGYEYTRFGNVYADEPFDANQAWRFHRRKMTVEDIERVTEVRAIQTDRMAKVNIA